MDSVRDWIRFTVRGRVMVNEGVGLKLGTVLRLSSGLHYI